MCRAIAACCASSRRAARARGGRRVSGASGTPRAGVSRSRARGRSAAGCLAAAVLWAPGPSPLRGDMVGARGAELDWFEGSTLLERLESLDAGADQAATGAFRFPVQLVSRPHGESARSYLGRIESGGVSVGDEVLALPAARRTRVVEIAVQGARSTHALAGDSVSLTLAH